MGSLGRCKQYLDPTLVLLVKRIYKWLARLKPNSLHCTKINSLAWYPILCYFHCFARTKSIYYHLSRLKCTLLPVKVAIFCRRIRSCHPLSGCVEEKLGRAWCPLKWNCCGQNCCHYRHRTCAQLLTAYTIGLEYNNSQMVLSMLSSAHTIWHIFIPNSPFHIFPNMFPT